MTIELNKANEEFYRSLLNVDNTGTHSLDEVVNKALQRYKLILEKELFGSIQQDN